MNRLDPVLRLLPGRPRRWLVRRLFRNAHTCTLLRHDINSHCVVFCGRWLIPFFLVYR